jgi:hypothetical protein
MFNDMKTRLIIFLIYLTSITYGQISISPRCFDEIKLGKDTKYDIEELWFYNLFQYTKSNDHGTNFYVSDSLHCNFLVNNEIIDAVSLNQGFNGIFNESINVKIGKSTFNDFIPLLNTDSLDITPIYDKLRIINGCYKLYLKNNDSINKSQYLIQDLENLVITRIVLSDFCLPQTNGCRPLYAPDSVLHCNNTKLKFHFTLSPFARQKDIPIGHWKTYYPNHQLKEEGKYNEKGRKIGIWKHYDFNGKLIKTRAYNRLYRS